MKNSLYSLFFILVLLSPSFTHAEVITPPVKPVVAKSDATVAPTLAIKKEQAYTDLSALTVRLNNITTRLETAIKQLADNQLDVSGVTPLLEKTKADLENAKTNLLVLAPNTPSVAATTPSVASTSALPAGTTAKTLPVVEEPSEEAVKTAVTSTEANLKSARQNLIDSITLLKTLISKAQTAPTQ